MAIRLVEGDLLDQAVDAVVNPWNRNSIPWWLLLPQGVSGAIKRRAGVRPFVEVAKAGRLALGEAVATSAGRLPFRTIIHVAGINDFWRASERSIRLSVQNALEAAHREGFASVAFPIIGAGSGGVSPATAEAIMREELVKAPSNIEVTLVRYRRNR